ncbi:hypothetical protein Syun_026615 [Stephania yunnanensis]|uniref:Protein TIFY n=1 Tax=Stephania yunnanensis TaxID=152371 RepID=A0AAP0HX62_9MAGN
MSVVSGTDSSSESGIRRSEKTSFAQTCSMLSQYLKENRGSFGDLSLAIASNSEGIVDKRATRNFLKNVELSGEVPCPAPLFAPHNIKGMDLFPQRSGFGVQDVPNKADFRAKMAPEPAQLTIFYGGKVFVFDNLTAEKANEVMLLASKANSQNVVNNQIMSSAQEAPPQRPPQAIPTDLPIARKASLQRFLEKRKDRISTRTPYQLNNSSANTTTQAKISTPLESNKSWLDMAPQTRNTPLELQL